jgi:hypothetical protein
MQNSSVAMLKFLAIKFVGGEGKISGFIPSALQSSECSVALCYLLTYCVLSDSIISSYNSVQWQED